MTTKMTMTMTTMTKGMIIGAAQNDDDNDDDNEDDNDDEENDNWGGSQASTQAISHLGALTNTCPSCYDQLAVMNRMMMMMMVLAMMMPTKGITVMAMMRVRDSSVSLKIQNSWSQWHDGCKRGKASSYLLL